MNKENGNDAAFQKPNVRITRTRAKALGSSGGLPPLYSSEKQDQKRVVKSNSKRAASDENKVAVNVTVGLQQKKRAVLKNAVIVNDTSGLHQKKRAVLKDVSNVDNSYINCINAANFQPSKQDKKNNANNKAKVGRAVSLRNAWNQEATESKTEEITKLKVEDSQEISPPVNLIEDLTLQQGKCVSIEEGGVADLMPVNQTSSKHVLLQSPSQKEKSNVCNKLEALCGLDISNIDSKHNDPQMCSLYAPDIHNNLRVMELGRRHSVNYMEVLQRDITQGMRSILIDWLVTVSEEYRLVPDTLYLAVNLIDRFLSANYIEKQKLLLLGVTCILIASKYEEICAPSVEEFCFITNTTYTKEEVLKMEIRVLNLVGFQLSVPTTKKFLRRFLQAAQVSYKVPCVELEFLANYLAELALIEYSFLKFLPSLIAASAIFLARWTLDWSDYPWNPTLQYYTRYKASELKDTVLALQNLKLNIKGCSLNAIREKYKQQKFKCVANLSSPKPVEALF